MSSHDLTSFARGSRRDDVPGFEASQFDRGARAFAFCCGVIYAAISGGLILAIVRATLAS
jgi:hypothetical protein